MLPVLLNVTQPYGRHTKASWGKLINNKHGWIIMEAPALLIPLFLVLFLGNLNKSLVIITIGLWVLHYFHRVVIYPLRIKTKGKKMPLVIALSGVIFNCVNGFLNGFWIAQIAPLSELNLWTTIRIALGIGVFLTGYGINKYHDRILINIRKDSEQGYKIPYGGLFKYVSCPNFLGEIITWGGFLIVTSGLAALSFFIWTIVNLLPRALEHHKWYKRTFVAYPPERKALVPGIL